MRKGDKDVLATKCSCGHTFDSDNAAFCPKCGTKRGVAEMTQGKNKAMTPEFKTLVQSLSVPSAHGYKGIFVGNKGSKKDYALSCLVQALYDSGKITDNRIDWIQFGDIPEKFSSDRLYVIQNIRSSVPYLFNLEDYSEDNAANQNKFKANLDRLLQAPGSAYIIIDATAVEKKGFITLDPRVLFVFRNTMVFEDLTNAEIFEEFRGSLPSELAEDTEQLQAYEEDFSEYLERNRRYYPFVNKDLANYIANVCSEQGSLILPEERISTASLDSLFQNIIGMAPVKKKLTELTSYLTVRAQLERQGAKLPAFNFNMMFLGNPGVGKTTIARIISKILFDLGYIKEDKLIDCTAKDLVGSHAGLTGVKTNRIIQQSMGGVLFIDEAYALNSCGPSGDEAIAILVKAMEDYRGEMVTMFAGYTVEMDDFIRSNSGIESRISYKFNFPDYTTDELLEILHLKVSKTGMTMTDEASESARKVLKTVTGRRNFGNGRFCDKMLQAILTKHANAVAEGADLMTIGIKSIPAIEEIMQTAR